MCIHPYPCVHLTLQLVETFPQRRQDNEMKYRLQAGILPTVLFTDHLRYRGRRAVSLILCAPDFSERLPWNHKWNFFPIQVDAAKFGSHKA